MILQFLPSGATEFRLRAKAQRGDISTANALKLLLFCEKDPSVNTANLKVTFQLFMTSGFKMSGITN